MKTRCPARFAHARALLLSLTLAGCSEAPPAFYADRMAAYDVWRLPLVEPYQLITADCCESWNFQPAGFPGFTADSVNFANGYILYYGYPGTYGFLDTRRRRLVKVATHRQFADSLHAKGLPTHLYKTQTVYAGWLKTGQLPWAEDILFPPPDK
jgi:hypothetical protein